MGDFIKNIAALFKVKTIVTLVVVAVFAALALREKLQPDTVMTIVTIGQDHCDAGCRCSVCGIGAAGEITA
nr:MAG TPA: FeoB-associated Cys-rich membrane protein [Caudoviricetes sp.]